MTTNKFITKAQARYGDKFDYSRVDYVNSYTPVTIFCPIHGAFQVKPHNFLHYKYGCPKCGHSAAGRKRCGVNNVAHRVDVKRKKRQTCLEKYGAKTWAESDAGRHKLHKIYYENNIGDKLEKTCLQRYGVRRASQTDAVKEKMRLTCLHKYGVDSVSKVPSLRDKYEETCLSKYGVRCPLSSKSIIDKVITAKAKNHTFNTSKPEEELYALLCDTFGSDDVIRQYKETRYPYSCDFYIKPFDIFIELNIHWTHGYTPYDATNEQHQERLKQLIQLSKDSSYYEQAIDVWTKRDVEKRQFAKDNKLNYVVFWDNDLADAKAWLLNWNLYH